MQFTNRPAREGYSTYLPLLKSYSGLNLEVGQDGLPTSGSGSIVINDQWESLGENRRVFDYFDRYTPINQTVTVYRAIETIGDTDMPSSWTVIYTGKVESYSKDKESLTFSVSNSLIESKFTSKTITSDIAPTGFEVPESSLGKTLPLVFGDVNSIVPAYSIAFSDTDKSTARYAYSANLASAFTEGATIGNKDVYALNDEGQYVLVTPSTSYASSALQTGTADPGGTGATSHGQKAFLVPLKTTLNGAIVTGLRWYCKGQNNGGITPTGTIVMTIYRRSATEQAFGDVDSPKIWEEIQSIEVNKSDYLASVQGATDFWVYGVFESPVVIQNDDTDYSAEGFFNGAPPTYAVGCYLRTYSGSSTTDFTSGGKTPNVGGEYYLYANTAEATGWDLGSGYLPLVGVDVADFGFANGSTDNNGFNYYYLGLTQEARNDRKCDLQQLDLSVSCPPLQGDFGAGDVYIYKPHEVCQMFSYSWDGSSWTDSGIFDTSTFTSLYSIFTSGSYQRKVIGFAEGEVTVLDIISQVAKEMCCFLVPLTNGKLAIWPWGNTGSVVRTFTDADIIEVGSIDETDPSTVINNIKIEYGKNYLNINDQWEASGKANNVTGVVVVNKGVSDYYNTLLANSESLYGKRELEESGAQFIADETSATTRALYFALRHDHTHRTFPVTIPYFDNTDLKLMDIVDILSVHCPSIFGTTSKARITTEDGVECDVHKGEYPRQAATKRCQILGLNNDYDGDFPKLVMTLREIKPRHKNDPTALPVPVY